MKQIRKIKKVLTGKPTIEGAGVHLKRIFGYYEAKLTDPFLLLDHFGSDNIEDYIKGFPWHPHRGIETVTYMIEGAVVHRDSLGNKGEIKSGDVQWMTAGNGIIHEEMPQANKGTMRGFQLWVNLPSESKMMHPRYQEIPSSVIPEITIDDIKIKIISGEFEGIKGPVKDIILNPTYFDINVPSRTSYQLPMTAGHTVCAYVFEGNGYFDEGQKEVINSGHLALFNNGDNITFSTKENSMRFILISGEPLREPIAWRGPIVMNTAEELDIAFQEYYNSNFIKA